MMILLLIISTLFTACKSDDDPEPKTPPPGNPDASVATVASHPEIPHSVILERPIYLSTIQSTAKSDCLGGSFRRGVHKVRVTQQVPQRRLLF